MLLSNLLPPVFLWYTATLPLASPAKRKDSECLRQKTGQLSGFVQVSRHWTAVSTLLYTWMLGTQGDKQLAWLSPNIQLPTPPKVTGSFVISGLFTTNWLDQIKSLYLCPESVCVYRLSWAGRNDWPAVLQTNTDDVSYLGCRGDFLSLLLLWAAVIRLLHVLHTQDWSSQRDALHQARSGSVQGEDLYMAMIGAASSTSNLITREQKASNSRQIKLLLVVLCDYIIFYSDKNVSFFVVKWDNPSEML